MKTSVAKTVLFSTLLCVSVAGALPGAAWGQTSSPVAPTLIPVSGRLLTAQGQPQTGTVNLTISLYDGQADASPRWIEQQLGVPLDASGGYSVQFGATLPDGLPGDLFTTGAGTRWLGVTVEGSPEQARVMLLSVPYAAKAATAETLGGKTASEFMLSSTFREDLRTVLEEEGVGGEVSAQGTTNFLAKYDGAGAPTANSIVFDNGTNIGIGTSSPARKLHVVGDIRVGSGNTYEMNNTGTTWMREASANVIQFFANSAERMRIDGNSGYVGIGTTSPQAPIHVVSNINSSTGFQVRNTNNGSNASVALYMGNDLDAGMGGWEMFSSTTVPSGRKLPNGMALSGFGAGGLTLSASDPSGAVRFMAGGSAERMRIAANGNIGIGTASPTAKLQVAGDVVVDGNIGAKYQDVAEWVDAAEPLEAGTLVVIDTTTTNRVLAAQKSYDGRVAGAVSAQPGLILGERGEGQRVLVAQSGRVKVKADAKFGAIRPGDLLVSSPTKGHVMRSKPVKVGEALVHRPGTVVGKALEALPSGKGEILVLLTLQ